MNWKKFQDKWRASSHFCPKQNRNVPYIDTCYTHAKKVGKQSSLVGRIMSDFYLLSFFLSFRFFQWASLPIIKGESYSCFGGQMVTHLSPVPHTISLLVLTYREDGRIHLREHWPLLEQRGITFFTLPNTQPPFKAAAITPGLGPGRCSNKGLLNWVILFLSWLGQTCADTSSRFYHYFYPVVLNWGAQLIPQGQWAITGYVFGHPNVAGRGWWVLLTSSQWGPRMLPIILQCTGPPRHQELFSLKCQ